MKVAVLITGQLRDYKINWLNHMKHLIEPNDADVFVYACTKNTIHTLSYGNQLDQKYLSIGEHPPESIERDVKKIYSSHLKKVVIDENEKLPEDNFGTLGYFRRRMQNQIDNIGKGFQMAKDYAIKNNFEYDIIVRCRPDNSMFPQKINLQHLEYKDDVVYSTMFSSGWRDLCFFAVGNRNSFEKYCSFEYMKGADPHSTKNPPSTEVEWEKYLSSIGIETRYIRNVCRPFYTFDKTQPITDFSYRNKDEFLIDANGNLVQQVEP